jgi:hypothetical protein
VFTLFYRLPSFYYAFAAPIGGAVVEVSRKLDSELSMKLTRFTVILLIFLFEIMKFITFYLF